MTIRGVCAAIALLTVPASGYYHFVRYTGPAGASAPIPVKFDLATLPNKTVTVLAADQGASAVSQPEAFPALLNVIREACRAWSSVSSSELRVSFGGVHTAGTAQTTPGIDVEFEELDPNTQGYGAPITFGQIVNGPNGSYVPVTRSIVRLNRDLKNFATASSGPSFTEAFFLTVTHELGHALGLQHTFTASTMSTDVTRSTALGRPLDADDIAGISTLYPSTEFLEKNGTITGRVTFQNNGEAVHLASVVAIRPTGQAVSAITDLDGRYRIAGLAPGSYQLYVHPPPLGRRETPGDLSLPLDRNGNAVPASGPFDTVFYQDGGTTRDHRAASFVQVSAGSAVENIQFSVRRRDSYRVTEQTTIYGYFGSTAVKPAYLDTTGAGSRTIVATGRGGLVANNTMASGLSLSFLGGTPLIAPNGVRAYAETFLAIDIDSASTFASTGPRHLIFSLSDDIYVRPNALILVQNQPPVIDGVSPNPDNPRQVTIFGRNLRADTSFYFDSVRATVAGSDSLGNPVLNVPPGIRGSRATVAAYHSDGLNSLFTQGTSAPAYTYEIGEGGFPTVLTGGIPAGSESMVEIEGSGTNFAEGLTSLGFGTSDVQVRRLWVRSANRLLANVWVARDAAIGPVSLSALSGFQAITQPLAIQIRAPNPAAPAMSSNIANAVAGQSGVFPGAQIILTGNNLGAASFTIADLPAEIIQAGATSVTLRVPATVAVGPAILRATANGESAAIILGIDPRPPVITGVTGSASVAFEQAQPAHAGDLLRIAVTGLPDGVSTSRVRVLIGSIEHPVIEILPVAETPGTQRLNLILSQSVPTGLQLVTVALDGRTSAPFTLAVSR